MCGLIALFDADVPIDEGLLERALGTLRTRGPDGVGRFVTPTRDVALGHARLAIVDVSGGAQPVWSESGRVGAMLNGELYGADTLRRELQARGHTLRTRCDAELLVHLYEDEGLALTRRLRGEYAFVLYDREERRLVAGRDPDGVRPLYLAQQGSRVWLGSTARALFAAGVPAGWDAEALAQAAALQYPPPGRTLFAGVRNVAVGGVIVVDASGVGAHAVQTREGSLQVAAANPENLATLRDALEDAVRVRIPAEVSYGCALSGGLDSSAILALAARVTGTAPPAFTVTFAGDPGCEWELAADTARALGARHERVDLTDEALAEQLPLAVRAAEGSAINAHLVGKWALARAVARAGHKVLLNGEGADEVSFGYAHFLVDAGYAPTPPQLAQLAGAMLSLGAVGPDAAERSRAAPGAAAALGPRAVTGALTPLPHFVLAKLELGARIHELCALGDADANARAALGALENALTGTPAQSVRARLERSRAAWRVLAFERYILQTLGDAVELAHGVEGRPPFLDAGVQRAAAAIAPEAFLRGGVEKQALRDALAGLLPADVIRRRKQPFFAAPTLLAERPGRLFALAHATLTGSQAPSFVDRAAVAHRLERARRASVAERREWEAPLMWLLTTALLEQELLR